MRPADTRNAADSQQVRAASRRVKDREDRWLLALKRVLSTPDGRQVFGDLEHGLIARFGVYASPFSMHGGELNRNVGRGDAGREILALCTVDEQLYLRMEKENRERAARNDRTVDAEHTASAVTGRTVIDDEQEQ